MNALAAVGSSASATAERTDPVTITTSIEVGTADLRAALTSVRVHASTDKNQPELNRIRLAIGAENVVVTGTDRFTAGLAIASVWNLAGDPCTVDLLPDDVAKVLNIFKAGTESADDEPEYRLRLDIGPERVTVTDCSGLIDGRALKVPRLPTADGGLSAIPAVIAGHHDSAPTMLADMSVGGESLARFKAAATAYKRALEVSAHRAGRALLVRCGESFLGLLVPRELLDADRARAREWAQNWNHRLPEIVAAAKAEGGDQ